MKLPRRSILGIAIDEDGLLCAQVTTGGGRLTVQRVARMGFDDNTSFDQPEMLGERLRAFLKQHHIAASAAAIGLPAKWLIAQQHEVPPATAQQAAAILRLRAERMAVHDNHQMVFDYIGDADPNQPSRVLVVGMLQSRLDQVSAACRKAGLTPVTALPTAMAVSRSFASDGRPTVVISRRTADVAWETASGARLLRHVGSSVGGEAATAGDVATLASELRRTLVLNPSLGPAPSAMRVWKDHELSGADVAALSERSGMAAEPIDARYLAQTAIAPDALNGDAARLTADAYIPAIAVALCSVSEQPAANFYQSRLAPPKPQRINRRMVTWIGVAVAAVLALVLFWADVQSRERRADTLTKEFASKDKQIIAAQTRLDRFGYGRTYFERRPPVLDCMADLSAAFPANSSIWATRLMLRDNRNGQVTGQATDQQTVLGVLGRMQQSGKFDNVQLREMQAAPGQGNTISFSLSFTYIGGQ